MYLHLWYYFFFCRLKSNTVYEIVWNTTTAMDYTLWSRFKFNYSLIIIHYTQSSIIIIDLNSLLNNLNIGLSVEIKCKSTFASLPENITACSRDNPRKFVLYKLKNPYLANLLLWDCKWMLWEHSRNARL